MKWGLRMIMVINNSCETRILKLNYPVNSLQGAEPVLFQCWASVVDAETTFKQHWFNALLGIHKLKSVITIFNTK